MERISWDQYFMAQSHLLALRSTCERLTVGATIVREKRIIAGGYNGSVSGDSHCIDEGCYVVDGHCVRTVHAEMNALLQCAKFGVPTEGAEMYVTHFPCLQCCKTIIQSGVKTVYYATDYKNDPYAMELFRKSGVDTKKVAFISNAIDVNPHEKATYVESLLEELEGAQISNNQLDEYKNKAQRLFNVQK